MKNTGFTLIELIAVIIILGLLAVIAAPRFINLHYDAHEAKLEGYKAVFQNAIDFAHIDWKIQSGNVAMNDLPRFGRNILDINPMGFPIGIDKNDPPIFPYNIGKHDKGCAEIFETIMADPPKIGSSSTAVEGYEFIAGRTEHLVKIGQGEEVTAKTRCYYIYTEKSYDAIPENAGYVMWYDSISGKVTLNVK